MNTSGPAEQAQTLRADTGAGVAIEVTFPFGRYHATAMGTAANDGVVEWPPSPWRILRALYSVWKTRCFGLDAGTVEEVLGALATPPSFHLSPNTAVAHSRHYMPGDGSTQLVHDTFLVCSNDEPALTIVWPTVALDAAQRDVLAQLCAGLTWLGRADSLADARLLAPEEAVPAPNSALVPAKDGSVGDSPIRLLVPSVPLDLDALTVRLAERRASAATRSTLPPAASLHTYTRPAPPLTRPHPSRLPRVARPTAVRFEVVPMEVGRGAARLPLADVVVHAAALRRAAMARFGGRDRRHSPTLSGRQSDGRGVGHGHAHYLPIVARADNPAATRIESFLVWAPAGFHDDELEALAALRCVRAFPWVAASRDFGVIMNGTGSPDALAPGLVGPVANWASVTPVVPGRHPKGRHDWVTQVELELRSDAAARQLPEPSIQLAPWELGRFTTVRPRPGAPAHRAHGARFAASIEFSHPVEMGTVVALGAQSHFGLGLFAPADG